MSVIARQFDLEARGTTVATELRGAVATFLTMSYIIFVNPDILAAAGVPKESAIACTAAAAGICCLLMGLIANFPLALASGMGLNAIVAFSIAPVAGSWQIAMALIVIEGVIILILVLVGLREAVFNAIPRDLRLAIGAGIGLFIAFIGAVNSRMVMVPSGTLFVLTNVDPNASLPPVTAGHLTSPDTALAFVGLLITAVLMARKVRGAIVIGIIATAALAIWPFGVTRLTALQFSGPSFEAAFQADFAGALAPKMLPILLPLLFAFLMVDFFDTLGTMTAIAEQADLTDERGRIPATRRILIVDSISASIGGMFGASSVTSYIESAAGVSEGARTGLHSVFVGLMFLAAIFAAPLAGLVPAAATAPALILVGFMMGTQIAKIDFKAYDTAIPAFITLIMMFATYSISHGIGYGFITYVAIKLFSLKPREVHPLMYAVAIAFVAFFIYSPV